MFYYFRQNDGTEAANVTWRTLGALDRVTIGSGVHLYATGQGSRLFAAAYATRFIIAGEAVSDGATIRSIDSGAYNISVTVQASGAVISGSATAIQIETGSVVNDGLISGTWGVAIRADATVRNAGTISAAGEAATLGTANVYSLIGLFNAGTLVSTEATAVSLLGLSEFTVVNTGEILSGAGAAIACDTTANAGLQLTNSGVIAGSVFTGNRASTIVNSGIITGTIAFGNGNDRYDGHAGSHAATVYGGIGDDVLIGGSGDDLLTGGLGADLIDGGAGRDIASYVGSTGVTIDLMDATRNTGEAFGDVLVSIERVIGGGLFNELYGTDGDERFDGGDGYDYLEGRGGDDQLFGGNGGDYLVGGAGRDRIDGGAGDDTVSYVDATAGVDVDLAVTGWQRSGGGGRDRLLNIESVVGSAFDDALRGSTVANELRGGDGNDAIFGGAGDDQIVGGVGNDQIDGGEGFDTASYHDAAAKVTVTLGSTAAQNTGGGGTDRLVGIEALVGSNHDDKLTGDTGNNVLDGESGADTLAGGNGDDLLMGGEGTDADVLNGGGGSDTADYRHAEDGGVTVSLAITAAQNTVNAGTDTLTGIENLFGSWHDDVLIGDAGDNVLRGRGGDDVLRGGSGIDTADYADAEGAVGVSLLIAGAQNTGGGGADTLVSIENLTGSAFNDTLIGSNVANLLAGGDGSDFLYGMGGNDRFVDLAGSNTIEGGDGSDTIDYSGAALAVTVHLETSTRYVTRGGDTDIVSVENFVGSRFGDTFIFGATVNGFTGGAGADLFRMAPGTAAQNIIRDFSGTGGDGDKLVFDGWDSDVAFTQIDATHWRISDVGHSEVITFTNAPTIVAADLIFT